MPSFISSMSRAGSLALLLAGLGFAQTNPGPASVCEAWMRHFNARDAEAVARLYASGAILVTEAGPMKTPAAVRQWVQVALDQGSRLEALDVVEEYSSGDLAYATARSRRLAGGEVHRGDHWIVLRRTEGQWKIVQHICLTVH